MLAVYALCAAYALFCLLTSPAGPITTPDSFHYLNMTPIVPLGYPFFLQLTGARGAIVAQPIVFAAALAFLGRQIVQATRSTWLALAIIAGIVALPQIREFHASILSESLFLSLLIAVLALMVRFIERPSWRLMVLIAIAVGVSATVRRTGFAFVPVMLVMVMHRVCRERHHAGHFFEGRRLSAPYALLCFVAALAAFALITGAERAIAPAMHGGASSSLMGRHMFAKAGLIEAPPAPPTDDPVRGALDNQLERAFASVRAMLASAPDRARGVLTIYYETCLQGGCADEARAATGETVEARQTEAMGAAGMARLRRAPWHFLQLTWLHYRSLWTVNRLRHPDTAADLNAFLAAHRPLPYEELALSLGPDRTLEFTASQNVRYAQYAISAVAIATGLLALVALVAAIAPLRLNPSLATAATAALTAHAGLVLTALLAAGFTRFLLGLWPALIVALGFAAHFVITTLFTKNTNTKNTRSTKAF